MKPSPSVRKTNKSSKSMMKLSYKKRGRKFLIKRSTYLRPKHTRSPKRAKKK